LLNDVLAEMVVIAATMRTEREDRERREREAERERRENEAARIEAEREAHRIKALTSEVERWQQALKVRGFVTALRAVLEDEQCRITPGGGFERWTNWAISYADRIDPVEHFRLDVKKLVTKRTAEVEALICASGAVIAEQDETREP